MNQLNRQTKSGRWFVKSFATAVVVIGVFGGLASASTQNFKALEGQTQPGMLVSLTANSGVVQPTTNKNAASLLGVITTEDSNFNRQPGEVSVATDGEATALVSTLGGEVRVGDRISPSSLAGIGAKTTKSSWIVGIAQASVDAKTKGAVLTTVTDSKGTKHQVYIASIPLVVNVTYYTDPNTARSESSVVPPTIQAAADAIAGRHVSLVGIVLVFLLLLTGVMIAGITINSAIKGGFAAVARQPLAKALLMRKVLQSFGVSAIILVAAFLAAFLLLKLL